MPRASELTTKTSGSKGGKQAAPKPAAAASQRVYLGILQGLEQNRLVPGQRLIETELAIEFGVGRNAVREAMQRLSVRGVVDLKPNQSASIRKLDLQETIEILEVATELTSLTVKVAASKYDEKRHGKAFRAVMDRFAEFEDMRQPSEFSRTRRQFYRTLLSIGENRELQRLFLAVGVHVIYSQHQSYELQQIRLQAFREIYAAVCANDTKAGAIIGRQSVERERDFIVRQYAAAN